MGLVKISLKYGELDTECKSWTIKLRYYKR